MPRNPERDAEREAQRRQNLLEAGFSLFSSHSIETVSLQAVAEKAGVGIATLYVYYKNKVNLVVAISASIWSTVLNEILFENATNNTPNTSAYQLIKQYTDKIIELYHKRPDLLRFSSNFKTFISHEANHTEVIREQNEALAPIITTFHDLYEKARIDHNIRTDIPEEELFTTITHTMLSMAERYSLGLAWADNHTTDHTRELLHLQEMLLQWCKG